MLIGNGGAELGVRGYVTAYDAETGEQAWRFYTVPGNPADGFENAAMEMAAKTWTGEWWKTGGGGTAWDAMAYDPELGLVYIGIGNGSPWAQKWRSPGGGDNLFLSSIVALDAETGEYRWHYQTMPGEEWDYTATQQMILADLTIDGKKRQVLMQAPKNGFFYVLDRKTGELISARNIVPINWASGIDMTTGRPIENPQVRYGEDPVIVSPAAGGAHNWNPMAFSPQTGLVYIPVTETYMAYSAGGATIRPRAGSAPVSWAPGKNASDGRICRCPFEGLADGLGSGGAARSLAHPERAEGQRRRAGHRRQPRVPGQDRYDLCRLSRRYRREGLGDAGAERADRRADLLHGRWRAIYRGQRRLGRRPRPCRTGQLLQAVLGKPRLLVFKLGGTAKLPPMPPESFAVPELLPPPKLEASAATVAQGEPLYAEHCSLCHGAAARGGVKDLRHMSPETHDAFLDIVLGGKRAKNGMASFADMLDEDAGQGHPRLPDRPRQRGLGGIGSPS